MSNVGRLFTQGQPAAQVASWELHGSELRVTPVDGGPTRSFDLQRAEVQRGGADDDQLILKQDGLTFYAPRAALEKPLKALNYRSVNTRLATEHQRVLRSGRAWWAAAALLVLLALGTAAGAWFLSDALVEQAALRTPVEWDVQIGEAAFNGQGLGSDEISDPRVREPLQKLVDELTRPYAGRGFKFQVHVIRSPQVNAFALPGGTMAVYTGLIEQADGPDELAGVLAHEIQHVTLRHGLRSVYSQLRWQIAIFVLAGSSDSLFHTLLSSGAVFSSLSYGRGMESQADLQGAALLRSEGYPTAGLATFFRKMEKERGDAELAMKYLSTHPPSTERLAALEAADANGVATHPLPLDWKALRAALKAPEKRGK